jgi:hypothetical protein
MAACDLRASLGVVSDCRGHVTDDETNIREVGRRMAVEAPNACVVLFGLHARGSATPRSDIDVLVIEPEVVCAASRRRSVELRPSPDIWGGGRFASVSAGRRAPCFRATARTR